MTLSLDGNFCARNTQKFCQVLTFLQRYDVVAVGVVAVEYSVNKNMAPSYPNRATKISNIRTKILLLH